MENVGLEALKEGRTNVFFQVVERHSKEELLRVIKEWLLLGSTIMSDCWETHEIVC